MAVRIEKNNHVWTVIYSRPEARNAMHPDFAKQLYDAFCEFEADATARVAVFWGEGGAFCAGFDLKDAATLSDTGDLGSELEFPASDNGQPIIGPMGPSRLALSKPVIAAIAGPAVAGGMELACWCDMRVMESNAYMGVYCRRWGVPLIDGGTVRLPRLVGQGRAMDLILTGRKVEAEECLRIGLCEYIVEEGQARTKAEELATQIASFPQSCMLSDRQSAISQQGLNVRDGLKQEWLLNREAFAEEGAAGAAEFAAGKGRHGSFEKS